MAPITSAMSAAFFARCVATLLMLQDRERLYLLVPAGKARAREIAVVAPHIGFAKLDDLLEDRVLMARAGIVGVEREGGKRWPPRPSRIWAKSTPGSPGILVLKELDFPRKGSIPCRRNGWSAPARAGHAAPTGPAGGAVGGGSAAMAAAPSADGGHHAQTHRYRSPNSLRRRPARRRGGPAAAEGTRDQRRGGHQDARRPAQEGTARRKAHRAQGGAGAKAKTVSA